MKSIFRDDHRQKQPENFKLKRNGFFSRFLKLFATVLVAFIVLEAHVVMVLVEFKYTRNTLIFLCVFIYHPRRLQC